MDMGNDREAARRELVGQYGAHQNAEQLIQAHRASRSPLAAAAALKPIDPDATAALDLDSIEVPDGHTVLSAAVRGNAITYVASDASGTWYKGAQPLGKSATAASVRQTPAEATAAAYDREAAEFREHTVDARAEVEARVAEFRAKEYEKLGKSLRKEGEQIGSAAEDAAKEAEKAQKDADQSGKGEVAGPNKPEDLSGPKQAESDDKPKGEKKGKSK